MASIHPIKNYHLKFNDSFFFDANVWVYLHCPIANHDKQIQKAYSTFYKQLSNGNYGLYVNSLVLSEFTNTYLRIDFKRWEEKEGQFGVSYKSNFVESARYNSTD